MERFWTFEHDGEEHDLECETQEQAEQAADDWWDKRNEDERTTREDDCFIISYTHATPDGDVAELSRTKYNLYYEYYHGDYAEHNTYWGKP